MSDSRNAIVKARALVAFLVLFLVSPVQTSFAQSKGVTPLRMSLQKRVPSGDGAYAIAHEVQHWNPRQTAVIICDMWNEHWCKGATKRVAEMAPAINEVITIARSKGVLIVHAPSSCMDFYKDHPARKLGQKYQYKKLEALAKWAEPLDSEKNVPWPINQDDGGCDDFPECKQGNPWKRQIDLIEITDEDAISDSGVEIAGLFKARGIKNVILMGVHENMCVIGRSFGLRNMVRLGMNVAVMRDLTDTMYDSKEFPVVSHFTGNSLMTEYIEKYVCPSVVSSDLTGRKQFRFKDDKRPMVAFVTAENEYQASQTLPAFAHDLLLTKGVNCEFAVGKPSVEGDGVHNIENLQILNDADLAVIFVRRRALPREGMKLLREYVNNGKPVLGIRTASHAFDAKKEIWSNGESSELLAQWPELDREVFGGNYQGHYGNIKEGIAYTVVPGMESHPLLKGFPAEGFVGPVAPSESLYKNRPLASPNAQVLLMGTIPGQPAEPVLWINHRDEGKVVYTSMGHWEYWKLEPFRTVMFNAVDYLIK